MYQRPNSKVKRIGGELTGSLQAGNIVHSVQVLLLDYSFYISR